MGSEEGHPTRRRHVALALRALNSAATESLGGSASVATRDVAAELLQSRSVEALADRVEREPELAAQLVDLVGSSTLRGVKGDAAGTIVAGVVLLARPAFELLAKDGDRAQIGEQHRCALEAIIRLTDRPSLLIRDGDYDGAELGRAWERLALDEHRLKLKEVFPKVGRIYVAEPGRKGAGIGTGWVGGDGLLVTNRHVTRLFGQNVKDGWTSPAGARVWVDFFVEEGSTTKAEFEITGVEHVVQAGPDLALLRVRPRNEEGRDLPAPSPSPRPRRT